MSVIGISGKLNSGKDTVGRIIQILKCDNIESLSVSEILDDIKNHEWWLEEQSGWEIKKFADKLKDTVCLWLGCSREELEDREFKEKELGEEWDLYNLKANNNEYYALNIPKSDLHSYSKTIELGRFDIVKMTPRKILQLLGTECGREIIHPNIWINSLFSDYKSKLDIKHKLAGEEVDEDYEPQEDDIIDIFPNWIITDVRFSNEAKAIKDREGILIRVERNNNKILNLSFDKNTKNPSEHPSETALDDYKEWDYIIENNGTIENLIEKVREILIKEHII